MTYTDEQLVSDIKRLLKERKRSLRSLASLIGVPYRTMQNYMSGESRIPAAVLIAIVDELSGGDLRYLRHGDHLLRHADLFDAIIQVLGDELLSLNPDKIGSRRMLTTAYEDPEIHSRYTVLASKLAEQISLAYSTLVANRQHHGVFTTIKEIKERREARTLANIADNVEVTPDPKQEIGQ